MRRSAGAGGAADGSGSRRIGAVAGRRSFRRPVDLVKAEFVRQRNMELAIDWPLPSPMRVLVFRAGGQALELGVWPTGSVDLMYRLYGDDSPMPLTNPPLPGVF